MKSKTGISSTLRAPLLNKNFGVSLSGASIDKVKFLRLFPMFNNKIHIAAYQFKYLNN